MASLPRILLASVLLMAATPAQACEPVIPFIHAVVPFTLAGSLFVLLVAVLGKSVLFPFFERRLPPIRAGGLMFLANILTSFIGVLVAAMIGSGDVWLFGVPVVYMVCLLPARRLVAAGPWRWLKKTSSWGLAALMTMVLLASCILFAVSQGAIHERRLAVYWTMKVSAIFLAMLASVTLTTVWEEWVIWSAASRVPGTQFLGSVLRTNLYILILVLVVPAAQMLPKRLKSPNFLARHLPAAVVAVHGAAR